MNTNKKFALLEIDDRVTMSNEFIERYGGPRLTGVVVGYRSSMGSPMLVKVRYDSNGKTDLFAPHIWVRDSDGCYGRDVGPGESVPGAVKAIETTYAGHRYRSRCEARWAIFLDVLNIAFNYELEGFELESDYYLPDFYLPQVKSYAEVKPGTFSPKETEKCHQLADFTGCPVLMLDGPPAAKSYYAALPSEDEAAVVQEEALFMLTNRKGCISNEGRLYTASPSDPVFEDTEHAVAVAKSARFEHGETGPLVVRVEVPVKGSDAR